MNTKHFPGRTGGRTIFYAGDDDSDRAAAYLLNLLVDGGYLVDYLPGSSKLDHLPSPCPDLLILSDYPRRMVSDAVLARVADAVEDGMHLLMIGGWTSFHGRDGEYVSSPLDRILPVTIEGGDDRVNTWQGVVVGPGEEGGRLKDLDWSRPPVIAGYNRLNPKPQAKVLVEGRHVSIVGSPPTTSVGDSVVLACTQAVGRGRATALGFDLAPHWIAGMVDWGLPRKVLTLPGTDVSVEVGEAYQRFVELFLSVC